MRFIKQISFAAVVTASLLLAGSAMAQTTVQLDDETQSTTFTATVSEQITVTVPAAVAFDVTNVNSSTAQTGTATIDITGMALIPGNTLGISLAPDAVAFTPPSDGTTWASSDISWSAGTGSQFTGAAGTMSGLADTYVAVGSCAEGVNACQTTDLVFTLAAKATVNEAGAHVLSATWKFESVAP